MSSDYHVENGRKGGVARSKKYWVKIAQAITLFVKFPQMNQQEIANNVGVSQAFVSKHTSYNAIKIARLSAGKSSISEEELERLLLKIKLEIELKDEIKHAQKVKL